MICEGYKSIDAPPEEAFLPCDREASKYFQAGELGKRYIALCFECAVKDRFWMDHGRYAEISEAECVVGKVMVS